MSDGVMGNWFRDKPHYWMCHCPDCALWMAVYNRYCPVDWEIINAIVRGADLRKISPFEHKKAAIYCNLNSPLTRRRIASTAWCLIGARTFMDLCIVFHRLPLLPTLMIIDEYFDHHEDLTASYYWKWKFGKAVKDWCMATWAGRSRQKAMATPLPLASGTAASKMTMIELH